MTEQLATLSSTGGSFRGGMDVCTISEEERIAFLAPDICIYVP